MNVTELFWNVGKTTKHNLIFTSCLRHHPLPVSHGFDLTIIFSRRVGHVSVREGGEVLVSRRNNDLIAEEYRWNEYAHYPWRKVCVLKQNKSVIIVDC